MSKTREVLEKAKAYVEQGWTQGAFARDADGIRIPVKGNNHWDVAVCHCSLGAIRHAAYDLGADTQDVTRAAEVLAGVISWDISVWNDWFGRTQQDVLNAFDEAINKEPVE